MSSRIAIVLGGRLKPAAREILAGYDIFEAIRIPDAGKYSKELEAQGTQAIITSGGTIAEILKHVTIPVISASLTYFDLLETLKEMESELNIKNKRVAMTLHDSLSVNINRLYPFINNEVTLFQYHDGYHLEKIINQIASEKYDVIVGGPTTEYYAKQYGLQSFLLLFGEETMDIAVKKTLSVLNFSQKDREQHQKLQAVFDIFPEGILATDQMGNVTMCNPNVLRILQLKAAEVIDKSVSSLMTDPSWEEVYRKGEVQADLIREYNNKKIFLTRQPIIVNGQILGSLGTFQEADKIEKLEHQYRKLRTKGLVARYQFSDIIAKSACMQEVIQQAKAYASVDSNIIIEGETGTGKEIFAQSIHNQSCRRHGPFVAINCAALPENLLESELMGYEEGAFTGAKRGGKAGLFELAHTGTIFFDEINHIPLQLQARVLRVIQERIVLRLGGEKVIPVDVHIIAASNENLANKIQCREFRNDLYYRLNVLTLNLPPLREREDDIPYLLDYYWKHFSSLYGVVPRLSRLATERLVNYSWPGNIRELTNFVERYVVLSSKTKISELAFIDEYLSKVHSEEFRQLSGAKLLTVQWGNLEEIQQQVLQQVLDRCGGNQFQAAAMLGISRTTVWNKLKKCSKNK